MQTLIISNDLERAYQLQEEIVRKREELRYLEIEVKSLIDNLARDGIMEMGNYKISDTVRPVRTVDPHRFKEKYPELFNEIAQLSVIIPVKDAEFRLGKKRLDEVCDVKEYRSRVVERKNL